MNLTHRPGLMALRARAARAIFTLPDSERNTEGAPPSVSAGQDPFTDLYPRRDSNPRYRLERAKPAQRIRAGQRGYGLVRSRVWGTHEARLALENVKVHASFRTRSTACDNRRRLASSRSGVEARSRRWRLLRAVAVAGPGGGGVCGGDRGADAGGIVAGQTGRLPGRQLGGKLDQRRRDSGAGRVWWSQ
jgi:hypothetical protein